MFPRIAKPCSVRCFHLRGRIIAILDKICDIYHRGRNFSWQYRVEDLAVSTIAKIVALLTGLEVIFVIFGELRRNFLLRKLIQDKNLSRMLINCSECKRFAKTILLLVSAILLCLLLCEFKIAVQVGQNFGKILTFLKAYGDGVLNVNILLLEISFCLLTIEQLIPTRKR
jgi:hypothetical protein